MAACQNKYDYYFGHCSAPWVSSNTVFLFLSLTEEI